MSGWNAAWQQWHAGEGCPLCDDRDDFSRGGRLTIFRSSCTVANLVGRGPQRGYAIVRWTGSHVPDPTALDWEQTARYWNEVALVARALMEHFAAMHINYETLGNGLPHLHTHLKCRFAEGDAAPGGPLSWMDDAEFDERDLLADAGALREKLSQPPR
jgi:diadenosine tetraphosphate (Ap4A) HIT family hydrolase